MFFDDFVFDDEEFELYYSEGIHPCWGCSDFDGEECISNGACASSDACES